MKKDMVTHAINILTCAIKDAPSTICDTQLQAIDNERQIFEKWRSHAPAPSEPSTDPNLALTAETVPRVPRAQPRV